MFTVASLKRQTTVLAAMSLLVGLQTSCTKDAPPAGTITPGATARPEKQLSEEEKRLEAWQATMLRIPLPKEGAFQASFPDTVWREAQSVVAPADPYMPKRGPRPFTVGNGDDVCAQAPSGTISSATGSFDSVTGVTSVTGQLHGAGGQVANVYTLQLNTNTFPSTVAGSAAGCRGWEQFIYANDGSAGNSGRAFIQYWLIDFGPTSPGTGWIQGPAPDFTTSWFRNSTATAVPNQPVANLGTLHLTGTVSATGDSYALLAGTTMFSHAGLNAVNAAAGWTTAEFCIVGNCCSTQATFNAGATIVPRTRITYGGRMPPICVATGFTGETNNLSFGPTAPGASAPGPAVIATQSTTGGAMGNCSAASTIGDTHLNTFDGLMYDFQATGDFILAQVDSNFVVQTRQVSGAPTWPDASVNSAVATRMGNSKVAVCLASGLFIDNVPTALASGHALSTPDGVDVSRNGNVYFITSASGNSVRATVHTSYIDVLVGIGGCCGHTVKGLLANHAGNVDQLAARDGAVLTNPFNFDAFYHHYTDSWRVSPKESLLPACGKAAELGIPGRVFFARDLDQKAFAHAREIALAAGVKEGPLLDAATLDVAVIGDDNAAKVFVDMHAPLAVGQFEHAPGGGLWGSWKWLLLVVLILIITWVFVRRRKKP